MTTGADASPTPKYRQRRNITMQNTYATQIETGTDVYGSDGEKIGSVAGIADDYFVIEKGFLFPTDIYVPMSAVAGVDDDRVTLSMSKDQVESADWTHEPTADADHQDRFDADVDKAGDDVLERREERLVVDKDVEKAGKVRVGKHVVEDRQAVDVPVTREEVNIERRSVDRPADGGEVFTEDSIDVPVYEETVQTGKEARVVEELEVGKTARTGTERVEETVRREEFDIEDDSGTARTNR
jgi:uncharacterized protein (TIGR02271 family)